MLSTALCLMLHIAAPASEPVHVTQAAPLVEVKKGSGASSSRGSSRPFGGSNGWLLAGGLSAIIPLVVVALPCMWFAWIFGPAAPFAFFVAVLWAGVVIAGASALAWWLMSAYGDVRGGFLLPVLIGGLVGAGITAVAGILAGLIIWLAWGTWGFFWQSGNSAFAWGFWSPIAFISFVIWAAGLITASIVGPLLAAWLHQRLGMARNDGETHYDVMTPNH